MQRGELYRACPPAADPPRFLIRWQELIDSRYSTIFGIPVYGSPADVIPEVPMEPESGLKQQSWIRCDDITGVPRATLRQYVGRVNANTPAAVRAAVLAATGFNPVAVT